MSKIYAKKYFIIGVVLGLFIIAVIITCIFAANQQKETKDSWVLRSYDNTVVLMNNGEVVEVFGDIVLDTLPSEDIKHLESGIPFLSKDEALMAIEDYDG